MVPLVGDCISQDPFGVALLENLSCKSDYITWKRPFFTFQSMSMGCELGFIPSFTFLQDSQLPGSFLCESLLLTMRQ